MALTITDAGLQAIGAEPGESALSSKSKPRATAKLPRSEVQPALGRSRAGRRPHPSSAAAHSRGPRTGSTQDRMIGLLRRPEGAFADPNSCSFRRSQGRSDLAARSTPGCDPYTAGRASSLAARLAARAERTGRPQWNLAADLSLRSSFPRFLPRRLPSLAAEVTREPSKPRSSLPPSIMRASPGCPHERHLDRRCARSLSRGRKHAV